ncbi:MAG: enhanced intracellular survival protein Eis [Candidatus Thorarchaeota archaeon]
MSEIREACEEDRESASRLLWKAFEATTSYEDAIKQGWMKRWNNPKDDNWAYVAVDNGKVVSNLSFFATNEDEQVIRGRPLRFAGVWAVATDAAYRRKGLVRKLFDASFPRMREAKAYLSILDPFYRPFYEKFGYAVAERRAKHVFTSNQIRVGEKRHDIIVREVDGPEDVKKCKSVERYMARFGSRFFKHDNTYEWFIKNGQLHILEDDSGPVGTAWFRYTQGSSGYDLTVDSTCYKSDDVFPSIIELVRNHAANAGKITWRTDIETPVRHYLSDIHRAESHLLGSMMMRVIDFEGYCRNIAIPKETIESVVVELVDQQCPWNTGVYSLEPNDGSLEARKCDGDPEIGLSAYQLSEVISGITPPTLLRSLHEIQCSEETARKLNAIFAPDTFVSYIRF